MPATPRQATGLVRPELGPSLPAWLESRFGIPVWVPLAVVGVVVAAVVAFVLLTSGGLPNGAEQRVHRSAPVFNVLYQPAYVHPATPRPGELERLVAVGPHVRVTVTIRRLDVPGFDRRGGYPALPIAADRLGTSLEGSLEGYRERDEGRANVNGAPGYQLRYRYRDQGRGASGLDVLVAPTPDTLDGALHLSLRQVNTGGKPGGRDGTVVKAARSAFRSLRFGTERG
jgi:hypothetical protein